MSQRWFWFGCLFEVTLGLVAFLLGLWADVSWRELLVWSPRSLGEGLAFCLPLLGFFGWAMHSPLLPLAEIRALLEERFLPLLRRWSAVQIALISVVAGIAEECLFRGCLPAALAPVVGPTAAALLAAVAFGLCHALTPAYAAVTALVGGFLGWECQVTGGLFAPILTHAAYDFAALLYLKRAGRTDPE